MMYHRSTHLSSISVILLFTVCLSSSSVSARIQGVRYTTAEIYHPGMTYEVAIVVTGEPGSITVMETPPAGWSITGIGSKGILQDGTITWELTSFTGSVSLIYKATPPQHASEMATFSGKVGADEITGISDLFYEVKSGIAESRVEKVASVSTATEGPVWHKDGFLLFCGDGMIKKWDPGEYVTTWRSIGANGLTFDPDGKLVACVPEDRRVVRIEEDGSLTTIADQYMGKKLNCPNDLCIRSDDMIFFTDPDYTFLTGARSELPPAVYKVLPGREPLKIVDTLVNPNGIALSPDEKKLYVADPEESMPWIAKPSYHGVRVFEVAEDGSLSNEKQFAPTVCDGVKVDREGNVYLSVGSVVVYSPEGKLKEVIRVPEFILNLAFGDADNKTLYMTAGNSVYKVRVQHPGVTPWKYSGIKCSLYK